MAKQIAAPHHGHEHISSDSHGSIDPAIPHTHTTVVSLAEDELDDRSDSLDGACLCHDAAVCPDNGTGNEDYWLEAAYEERPDAGGYER